jgi:hypothetical protein
MLAGTLAEKLSQGEHHAQRPMADYEHDVELVCRLADGDETDLRELVAAYGQRLYAYALRRTGSPITTEDVVQDTLRRRGAALDDSAARGACCLAAGHRSSHGDEGAAPHNTAALT